MHFKKWGSVTAAIALASTLAACGGSSGAGSTTKSADTGKRGGTLDILMISDFEHLDPQRNYVDDALNFGSRLLYRSLTGYKSVPGQDGSQIVPDLASDLGTPSDNDTVWTFHLRPNLKFEDGEPITCADEKYGIERSFSDQITDGPAYAKQDLIGGQNYPGPYKDGGKGLASIVCKDNLTIEFHLNKSIGDFNYTVSLPTFSPVPKDKDTNVNYDNHPISSGPYKIQTYVRNKSMVLVRNPYWDPKTDPIRKAYPDQIDVTFGVDPTVIDQRLIADAPQDQTAIMLDSSIQAENLATVMSNPQLKARTISGFDGFTRYLGINTRLVPNLKVRQAIEWAVNKQAYRGTRGGVDAGDYATSVITPALKSHKNFNLYPAPATGDPAKAKQLLTQAGALGFKLTLDLPDTPQNQKSGAAIQDSLQQAGFKVSLNPINPDTFYTTIGSPAVEHQLVLAGWGPDWPSGSAVIPPLFDGRQIVPQGNENFSLLNDPQVQQKIIAAQAETDPTKQAQDWGDLDELIMSKAAVVPLLWTKTNQIFGSKVHGAYMHAFYGEVDLATLSVA